MTNSRPDRWEALYSVTSRSTFCAKNMISLLRKPPADVDVLLMEGEAVV
jgi:hypothetical protein